MKISTKRSAHKLYMICGLYTAIVSLMYFYAHPTDTIWVPIGAFLCAILLLGCLHMILGALASTQAGYEKLEQDTKDLSRKVDIKDHLIDDRLTFLYDITRLQEKKIGGAINNLAKVKEEILQKFNRSYFKNIYMSDIDLNFKEMAKRIEVEEAISRAKIEGKNDIAKDTAPKKKVVAKKKITK